ncbi:MAG: hypothetical protein GY862_12775, partial [Gammaproteobacteria bacterium]|nr:hypothetical protein [Gammaproteobacteria bacterium]
VPDRYINKTDKDKNKKTSTYSIFSADLKGYHLCYDPSMPWQQPPIPPTCGAAYTLNRFNFEAAHKFLIPRATAYSAGLIDYFFRGQLKLAPPVTPAAADEKDFIEYYEKNGEKRMRMTLRIANITPDIGDHVQNMENGKMRAVIRYRRNGEYEKLRHAGRSKEAKEYALISEELEGQNLDASPAGSPEFKEFSFVFKPADIFDSSVFFPLPHSARRPEFQIVFHGELGKREGIVAAAKEFEHVIETAVGPDPDALTRFELHNPVDLAFDADGNLYISDTLFIDLDHQANRQIFKMNPNKKGTQLTVAAGNGEMLDHYERERNDLDWWEKAKENGLIAANTPLSLQTGVDVDKTTGTLYFTDYVDSCIWKIKSGDTRMFPAAGRCGYGGGGHFVWDYIDDDFRVHPYLYLASPFSVAAYQGSFYFIDDVGAV